MKPVQFHDAARVELLNEVSYYAKIDAMLGQSLSAAAATFSRKPGYRRSRT